MGFFFGNLGNLRWMTHLILSVVFYQFGESKQSYHLQLLCFFCILSHTTGWNSGSICQYHLSALIVIAIYDPISKVMFAGQLLVM